jgi:hypothetical protein
MLVALLLVFVGKCVINIASRNRCRGHELSARVVSIESSHVGEQEVEGTMDKSGAKQLLPSRG